ncbi:MAG: GNAT family N-acetyltransferase [Candidatus Dormibacteria bacterium]
MRDTPAPLSEGAATNLMAADHDPELLIRAATTLAGPSAESFTHIYEESFPPSEREDVGGLLDSIASGERLCYLAISADRLVGLAVLLPLRAAPVAFLEYLAVDATLRRQGIGGRMLDHLSAALPEAATHPEGILLEVEPVDTEDAEERRNRVRRIALYERKGATVVECAPRYRAPDLVDDTATLPYTLMWLPLPGGPREPRGALLRDAMRAVLTESYQLDATDPLVAQVVDGLTC